MTRYNMMGVYINSLLLLEHLCRKTNEILRVLIKVLNTFHMKDSSWMICVNRKKKAMIQNYNSLTGQGIGSVSSCITSYYRIAAIFLN